MSLYLTSQSVNNATRDAHLHTVLARLIQKYTLNQKLAKNTLRNKELTEEKIVADKISDNLIGHNVLIKKTVIMDVPLENKAEYNPYKNLRYSSTQRMIHANNTKNNHDMISALKNEQLLENKIPLRKDKSVLSIWDEKGYGSQAAINKKLRYRSLLSRVRLYFHVVKNLLERVCLFFIFPECGLVDAQYDKKNSYFMRKNYRFSTDKGATTAEYAIVILAATAFAGVLLVILKSDTVKQLLLGIIKKALSI